MRHLKSTASGKAAQQYGGEPINIVYVNWKVGGFFNTYMDKLVPGQFDLGSVIQNPDESTFFVNTGGIPPKATVLSISNLSTSSQVDGHGSATTVTITLDDQDGELRKLFQTMDMHRRPVVIAQYFQGMGWGDQFLIFTGETASPISWDEGERTLTFSIATLLSKVEVGFAPESGQFTFVHEDLVGKPWPLAFGTNLYVPATPLSVIPQGVTDRPFGLVDPTLQDKVDQNSQLASDALLTAGNDLFFAAIANAAGDENASDQFNQDALNQQNLAAQITADTGELHTPLFDQLQWAAKMGNVQILSNYPVPNGDYLVKINETLFKATVRGGPNSYTKPIYLTPYYILGPKVDHIVKDGFAFFQGGSQIQLLNFPTTYIYNIIPAGRPIVSAYRSANNNRQLVIVPPELYKLSTLDVGFLSLQLITFPKPLSSISYMDDLRTTDLDAYLIKTTGKSLTGTHLSHILPTYSWEDQPYCTFTSSVGPDMVDIIRYLVTTYSNKADEVSQAKFDLPLVIDEESFGHVKQMLANYPMNFVLQDRPDLYSLISSLAYQNRCALWIENGKVFLKYLPEEVDAVTTITLDDIKEETLTIEGTETENLITKYTANWKTDARHDKQNQVIVRANIAKYGTLPGAYDYFALTNYQLVVKSATFWLIRRANTWKRVKCKVFLKELLLQIFDTVLLDFSAHQSQEWLSKEPVKAIVESVTYSSEEREIEVQFWVPIRFGEDEPFLFAWPAGISENDVYPFFAEVTAGNGGSGTFVGASGGGGQKGLPVFGGSVTTENPTPGFLSSPMDLGDKTPSDASNGYPQVAVPLGLIDQSPNQNGDYVYKDYTQPTPTALLPTMVWPGQIVSHVGDVNYRVRVWKAGFNKNDTSKTTVLDVVYQLDIADGEVIPDDSFVVVYVTPRPKSLGGGYHYWMMVPCWFA